MTYFTIYSVKVGVPYLGRYAVMGFNALRWTHSQIEPLPYRRVFASSSIRLRYGIGLDAVCPGCTVIHFSPKWKYHSGTIVLSLQNQLHLQVSEDKLK